MEIEMTVRLLIPDTTALTAFHTLEKMGFRQLKKLEREDYYKFSIESGDFEKTSRELGTIDILVNANKHRFKTKLAGQSELKDESNAVHILVQDIDNKDGGLLKTLQNRLGFMNIKSMEKGVLWTLYIEDGSPNDVARDIAEKLLVNKHYQEYKIIFNSRVTYKDSGVNIDVANEAKRKIKDHVRRTFNANVALDMGAFAGAINTEKLKKYNNPILVSSIDGVGTKLMIAAKMNKWDTVGKDIVNHSANDILAVGGEPFFFMDYIACEKMKTEIVEQIIKGMADACIENDMPLVGGETAEMPGVYAPHEYDVAGCIIGIVDKDKIIDGSKIREGDVLIGLESVGLHTNGYSLARKVLFDIAGYSVDDYAEELGATIGEKLLVPHKSYSKVVLELMKHFNIHGIAHITGGGLLENIPRILPQGLAVEIEKNKINIQPIFKLIQKKGNVPEDDMFRTFNMGVGLVIIVPEDAAKGIIKSLESVNQSSSIIGKVVYGTFGVKII